MTQSMTQFVIMFFIFQLLTSQIDQNGVNPFCDDTLHILSFTCEYAQYGYYEVAFLCLLTDHVTSHIVLYNEYFIPFHSLVGCPFSLADFQSPRVQVI